MSRKSRKPPKLALVRADDVDATPPDESHVYRIEGRARAIFDSLVFADVLVQRGPTFESAFRASLDTPEFAALVDAQIGELDDEPDIDDLEAEEAALDEELDELDALFTDFDISIHILAQALITELLGGPLDPNVLADLGSRTVDDLIRQFDRVHYPEVLHPRRTELEDSLYGVGSIVHAIGLDVFDVYCSVVSAADGSLALSARPLPPFDADVLLLDQVLGSAQHAADAEDGTVLENAASVWEFDRWSVAYPPESLPELAREIRCQEYYLLDRPYITLGASIIDLLAHGEAAIRISPRQKHLAAALTESFVDVFEVTQIDGKRAIWKSVAHGTSYDVHIYSGASRLYEVGWIALGRLLPFADDLHLHSPGTILVPPTPGLAKLAAESLSRLEDSIHATLALEATISSVLLGAQVPSNEKPMPSRSKARLVLEDVEARIADGLQPDSTIEAYRKALKRQAESTAGSSNKSKPKRRKGR